MGESMPVGFRDRAQAADAACSSTPKTHSASPPKATKLKQRGLPLGARSTLDIGQAFTFVPGGTRPPPESLATRPKMPLVRS